MGRADGFPKKMLFEHLSYGGTTASGMDRPISIAGSDMGRGSDMADRAKKLWGLTRPTDWGWDKDLIFKKEFLYNEEGPRADKRLRIILI